MVGLSQLCYLRSLLLGPPAKLYTLGKLECDVDTWSTGPGSSAGTGANHGPCQSLACLEVESPAHALRGCCVGTVACQPCSRPCRTRRAGTIPDSEPVCRCAERWLQPVGERAAKARQAIHPMPFKQPEAGLSLLQGGVAQLLKALEGYRVCPRGLRGGS